VSQIADAVRKIGSERYSFVVRPYAEPIAPVRLEACRLLSHAAPLRVEHMAHPHYSVAAKIERRFLPDRKDD
jgi:hypothetical protein